jgi:hypothetical protein
LDPDEFHELRRRLGLDPQGMADALDVDLRRTRRWEAGTRPIPDDVAEWLSRLDKAKAEWLSAWVRRNPPPCLRGRPREAPRDEDEAREATPANPWADWT